MPRTLLGSRIRERREAIGLKQIEVARKSGISAPYLNLIEHNRRRIAGKVLIDIAGALGLEVSSLLEGADSDLIQKLQNAAARDVTGEAGEVELDRAEELVSRFPGWSRLLANLEDRTQQLGQTVDGLSDRLTHDPFLAESLHEILSSVTAIHATSGILTNNPAMEGLQQRRFQANILEESARLSELSQGLVSYFDQQSETEQSLSTPLDEVEAFLEGHGFHFADLEAGKTSIASLIDRADALISQASRQMAASALQLYLDDAGLMPLPAFLRSAETVAYSPSALAREFSAPIDAVYRRLAFLPDDPDRPDFGLISCDGTGAVLLRKPLQGFALPRYGSACALWPLYQAMTRPHVPITADLRTTENRIFHATAQSGYSNPAAEVPVLRATMIFRSAVGSETGQIPPLEIGLSCRICTRSDCPARRELSIHG